MRCCALSSFAPIPCLSAAMPLPHLGMHTCCISACALVAGACAFVCVRVLCGFFCVHYLIAISACKCACACACECMLCVSVCMSTYADLVLYHVRKKRN